MHLIGKIKPLLETIIDYNMTCQIPGVKNITSCSNKYWGFSCSIRLKQLRKKALFTKPKCKSMECLWIIGLHSQRLIGHSGLVPWVTTNNSEVSSRLFIISLMILLIEFHSLIGTKPTVPSNKDSGNKSNQRQNIN